MNQMKQYKELAKIAKRIEEIRIELYNSPEHKENMFWEEEFEDVNNQLFKIQSDIHSLVDVIEMCS